MRTEQLTQSWDCSLFCVLSLIWTQYSLHTQIKRKFGWILKFPWFIFSLFIPSTGIIMGCFISHRMGYICHYHTRWRLSIHYSNFTCVSWCLSWQSNFVQQLGQANKKETFKLYITGHVWVESNCGYHEFLSQRAIFRICMSNLFIRTPQSVNNLMKFSDFMLRFKSIHVIPCGYSHMHVSQSHAVL